MPLPDETPAFWVYDVPLDAEHPDRGAKQSRPVYDSDRPDPDDTEARFEELHMRDLPDEKPDWFKAGFDSEEEFLAIPIREEANPE